MATHPLEVDAFALCAREYCAWCIVDKSKLSPGRYQFEATSNLAKVYAAFFTLPATEFIEAPDVPRPSQTQIQEVLAALGGLPFREYWEVFKPTQFEPGDPCVGDISDDFLDTYIDLAEGLWLYDHGHVQAAVWQWRFTFGIHWGTHATSALRALQGFEA